MTKYYLCELCGCCHNDGVLAHTLDGKTICDYCFDDLGDNKFEVAENAIMNIRPPFKDPELVGAFLAGLWSAITEIRSLKQEKRVIGETFLEA